MMIPILQVSKLGLGEVRGLFQPVQRLQRPGFKLSLSDPDLGHFALLQAKISVSRWKL